MVEAAGQLFRIFQCGLDYAFIAGDSLPGCGAYYRWHTLRPILVPAPVSTNNLSESMSLYRAERVGLDLPLGVAMPF